MRVREAMIASVSAAFIVFSAASARPDTTSLSYVSRTENLVQITSLQAQDVFDANATMPILVGDRLDTAALGRAELVLADRTRVWIDGQTTVDFDAIAFSRDIQAPRTALFLARGAMALEVPENPLGSGVLKVGSPAGVVFINGPGLYRLEVLDGSVRVETFAGQTEVPVGIHSRVVKAGLAATMDGKTVCDIEWLDGSETEFWGWVTERRSEPGASESSRYVPMPIHQARELDEYGDWIYSELFATHVWRPRVARSWMPYSVGQWLWTPVGLHWVSHEPWGWLPYHYGSWFLDSDHGWVWHWGRKWGPAWVHWAYLEKAVAWVARGLYDWAPPYDAVEWEWKETNKHELQQGGCNHPCCAPRRPFPPWMPPIGPLPPPGPGRGGADDWTAAALDLSGRFRLSADDLRDWVVVPTARFTSGRLDRERVGDRQLARLLTGKPEVTLHSGPLVSRRPPGGAHARHLSAVFRELEALRTTRETVGRGDISNDRPAVRRRQADNSDLDRLTDVDDLTRRAERLNPIESRRTAVLAGTRDTRHPSVPVRSGAGRTPSAGPAPGVWGGDPSPAAGPAPDLRGPATPAPQLDPPASAPPSTPVVPSVPEQVQSPQ